MRGLVAFPNMVMHFDVAREKSIKAIRKALEENGKIFRFLGVVDNFFRKYYVNQFSFFKPKFWFT